MFENKITHKKYVGQTVRSFDERLKEHVRKRKTLLGKAINKYGLENFYYCVLYEAKTIEELNEMEKYFIKVFDTVAPNGYNLCIGGENTAGYKHTSETKHKMRLAKKGMYKGKENPFYKKKHSDEVRARMRKAWSEERRKKQSERSKSLDRSYQYVKVRNKNTGEIYNSVKEASQATGALATHITRVCKGRRKTTRGIAWEYV